MAFDIDGAKKAGYSDNEIAQYLAQQNNFDYDGAVKSGYSPQEIVQHLTSSPAVQPKSEWDAIKGAVTAIRNGESDHPDQAIADLKQASSLPVRGLQGITTAIAHAGEDNPLQAGADAVAPGYEPQTLKDKVAAGVAALGDPRFLPVNGVLKVAGNELVAPAAKFLGSQAAKGMNALSGVPTQNIERLFAEPISVLGAQPSKVSGEAFQAAKNAVGVSPAEERMIAQVDLGGYKKVADEAAAKLAAGESLSPGELLAAKKAAYKVSQKTPGSARAIYSQDFSKFSNALRDVAPEVATTQGNVALSKTRDSFINLLPQTQNGKPAVLRTLAGLAGAGGAVMHSNPLEAALAAAIFSPAATGAATLAAKGATEAVTSPLGRQAIAATAPSLADLLSRSKSHQ